MNWFPFLFVSQCQEQRLGGIPLLFASQSCMENNLEPVVSNTVQSLLTSTDTSTLSTVNGKSDILENMF